MNSENINYQDARALADHLLAVADNLHAQLVRLHATPSASGAEAVAINLEGLRRYMLRLADMIRSEMAHGPA